MSHVISGHADTLFEGPLRAQSAPQDIPPTLRPALPRRSEQVAQYKSFQLSSTPLGIAFRKSTSALPKQPSQDPPARTTQSASLKLAESIPDTEATKPQQSRLDSFFRSSRGSSNGPSAVGGIWTLGVRLRNPHSLCYLNAGALSLVHFLEVSGLLDYAALAQACRQAQRTDRILCLSQQLVVRSIFAGWRFSDVQRDCAELMTQAISQCYSLWSEWELRDSQQEVRETGTSPIILPLPGSSGLTLQFWVDQWRSESGGRALTSHKPVMVQLGRSTEHGKNHSSVSFDGPVLFPVKHGNVVEACEYHAVSGVVHLGQSVTSGHYRAILKQGSQRYMADDSVVASPVPMDLHVTKNVYVLWLQPSPNRSAAASSA